MELTYNAAFALSTQKQPGNVVRTYTRTTSDLTYNWSFTPSAADSLLFRSAAFDSAGRIRRMWRPSAAAFDQRITQLNYDGRGRLVAATDSLYDYTANCPRGFDPAFGSKDCVGQTPVKTQRWKDSVTYDGVGNITRNEGHGGTGAATYAANRIVTWPGGFTFQTDSVGNVTHRTFSGVTKRYFWSPDGLLDSVVAGTRRLAYEYNAFGQLVRRRLNGAIDRHFAWDQGHLLIEMNGTLSSRLTEYAYYPGTDEPMVVLYGATTVSTRRFVYQDAQGTVMGLVNAAGGVYRNLLDADPWGTMPGTWNSTLSVDSLRLRWQGLFYEADSTSLYYVRAQWYDPLTKRFMSPDPIGLAGGVNPYLFAGGDPMNAKDPSGLLVSDRRGVCSLNAGSCGNPSTFGFEGDGGGGGGAWSSAALRSRGNYVRCKRINATVWDCDPNATREGETTFGVFVGGWRMDLTRGLTTHLSVLYRGPDGVRVIELCGWTQCHPNSEIKEGLSPFYAGFSDYTWVRLGSLEDFPTFGLALNMIRNRYHESTYRLADSNCFVYDVVRALGASLTDEQRAVFSWAPCLRASRAR